MKEPLEKECALAHSRAERGRLRQPTASCECTKKLLSSTDWELDIQACSATDCTGLIPALPETEAELEHYQDLYHYLPDFPDRSEYLN